MSNYFSRKDLIYKVYQEKSISKAAQKLFISQPALSVMIQRIEDEIGVPLFDRTTKPISLTEAGMEYIKATEAMMHTEKAFENYLQAYGNLQTGSLTIGSNQLLSSLVLPRFIGRFLEKYPKIHLELVDDNSVVLENLATAGQLDLVLDNHPLDRAVFEQHIIRQEQLLLAVPRSFACNEALLQHQLSCQDIRKGTHLQMQSSPSLDAFRDVPFVAMTKNNETRHRFDEIFREAGFKPQVILELDRLATLFSFVEQGSAASIISDTLVQYLNTSGEDVVFYSIGSDHARRDLYLSYKRSRYYSKAMEAFAEIFKEFSQGEAL